MTISNSVDLIKYFLQQRNITKKPSPLKPTEPVVTLDDYASNPSI